MKIPSFPGFTGCSICRIMADRTPDGVRTGKRHYVSRVVLPIGRLAVKRKKKISFSSRPIHVGSGAPAELISGGRRQICGDVGRWRKGRRKKIKTCLPVALSNRTRAVVFILFLFCFHGWQLRELARFYAYPVRAYEYGARRFPPCKKYT